VDVIRKFLTCQTNYLIYGYAFPCSVMIINLTEMWIPGWLVAICMMLQLQKECELMQQRAEAAEGVLERERGVHRRELRRRAKELADMQDDLVQVTPLSSLWLHALCCNGSNRLVVHVVLLYRHLSTIAGPISLVT